MRLSFTNSREVSNKYMRAISQESAKVVILAGVNPVTGEVVMGGSALGPGLQQYSTVTNTLITSNSTTFTIPSGGKALIQSWDDEAVFVKLGAGASASDASFILAAGTAANDGKGGSFMIDDYTGVVSVFAAGTVRVNVAVYS